jgi:hypothetical protein
MKLYIIWNYSDFFVAFHLCFLLRWTNIKFQTPAYKWYPLPEHPTARHNYIHSSVRMVNTIDGTLSIPIVPRPWFSYQCLTSWASPQSSMRLLQMLLNLMGRFIWFTLRWFKPPTQQAATQHFTTRLSSSEGWDSRACLGFENEGTETLGRVSVSLQILLLILLDIELLCLFIF